MNGDNKLNIADNNADIDIILGQCLVDICVKSRAKSRDFPDFLLDM